MNAAIAHLSVICQKERFREKLLFVPSYSLGHQIGEYLARTGNPWINLRTATVSGYTQQVVGQELAAEGIRLIDSTESLIIVESLYREAESSGSKGGNYFQGASQIPGILKCLAKAIDEMRMSGIEGGNLDPGAFIVREKGEELIWLLEAYGEFLLKDQLTDQAGLLRRAIKKIESDGHTSRDTLVMVLSDFPFSDLEKKLIQLVGGENLIIIDHEKPRGLSLPGRFFKGAKKTSITSTKPAKNIDLLPWVYDPENAPGPFDDRGVDLFSALGESNEIREVFRRIFKEEIPIDDVEILVTGKDPYNAMIYEIASSLEVPVTFSGGIPVSYTRPGKALNLYFKWQAEDFQEGYIRQLFSGGFLNLNGSGKKREKPSSGRAGQVIREAAIGWGRERYVTRLNALEESMLKEAQSDLEDMDEEDILRAKRNAEKIAWVAQYVKEILETVPEPAAAGLVNFKEVCRGAVQFLGKFCWVAGELDGAARLKLLDVLEALERVPSFSEPVGRIAERFLDIICEITVAHSNPKPGHLHVSSYRSGGYSGRGHTFIVGMDQKNFPGTLIQDPVILDQERKNLGMVLSEDLLAENIYTMTRVLGSLKGNLALSYSSRDLQEDRESFPSSLLLGVYRVITSNRNGDYRAMMEYIGEPRGFIPPDKEMALNDWEWWLARKGLHFGRDSVLSSYKNLFGGEKAEAIRGKEKLSEFDGWIPSAQDSFDPLKKKIIFSCSRLEYLAKCPFAYFMKYILRIEPLEEIEKDASQWLEAWQRGELLHEVFYRFMETLKKNGQTPVVEKHSGLLRDIAQEEIEHWKKEIPVASELAFNREIEIINECLRIFLRDEEEHCKSVDPYEFELAFGLDQKTGSGKEAIPPVVIPLAGKKGFMLRGRIDRVDRCGPHEYEIWDYKTGSSWGFNENGFFDQGWHLQHALYALAAESLLRNQGDPKAKVVRSGYFFTSMKGVGKRIEKDQSKRKELGKLLDDLFTILRSGVFSATSNRESCTYCDYQPLCGGADIAVERVKGKIGMDEKLEPLKRLEDYA
jgi:hypothetical protein